MLTGEYTYTTIIFSIIVLLATFNIIHTILILSIQSFQKAGILVLEVNYTTSLTS